MENQNDRRTLLTGWKKDLYDRRDMIYRPKAVVMDYFTMAPIMPVVRDQGNVGSCVGHGFGGVLTALAVIAGVDPEWFSPTWIYNGARFIEGTLNQDVGCYPRNAAKWIADKGGLKEHFWPYNPARLDTKAPGSSLEPFAAEWPIVSYARVAGGVDGLIGALADGKPIAIGNPWYDEWMATDRNGMVPKITEQTRPDGGHETVIYGFDRRPASVAKYGEGVFLVQNSWGNDWGLSGRFLMPMSAIPVFLVHGGFDAYTMDVSWRTGPEPESASPIVIESGSPEPPDPPKPKPNILKWVVIAAGIIALAAFILRFII